MKKTIDCLLVGHNEVKVEKYVSGIERMGAKSGAFRDLNLSFFRFNRQPYHAAGIFNWVCRNAEFPGVPPAPIREGESFSNTIAYLGTYLERRSFTFDYIHSFQAEKETLAEKLRQENILTIAITTTLYISAFPIIEVIDYIRKYNQTARIIVGGPFVLTQHHFVDALSLQYLFKSINADIYVVSSRGEDALVNIIRALKQDLPLDKIANVYYKIKSGDQVQYICDRLVKENNILSENMLMWDLFSGRIGEYANLRTSISCPFSCAFCGFPERAGKYQTANIKAVEQELDLLDKIGKVKSVFFIDDTLNIPGDRFKDFLEMLIRNKYGFRWQSQLRCQFVDEETVALMKESGCEGVFLGLESGNDQILGNMNKKASAAGYLKGISLLKQYEILTHGSFILGFPGETHETVRDTIRLIKESKIDFYRVQLWYCEPITPIWREREKYRIKGSRFGWSHATMDFKEACDLIDRIFLSIEEATWLPQYGFDFNLLFHLLHRGLSRKQVKNFIKAFNEGIKEKLSTPSPMEAEASPGIIKKLVYSLTTEEKFNADALPGKSI